MAVNMYAKCGCLLEARRLFDAMAQRTVVSWTALMQGYVDSGQSRLALELFQKMEEEEDCQPNARTFVVVLLACTSLLTEEVREKSTWLEKAESVYLRAVNSKCCDIYLENTMVSLYSSCGEMNQALHVFGRMAKHSVVSWNALLQGYVENGKGEAALELFERMLLEKGCSPDPRSYLAAIRACASLAFEEDVGCGKWLHKGKSLHSRSVEGGCCNIFVENALIDMYSKCRSMADSQRLFDGMCRRDLVSWNTLLRGYVHNGENQVVLEMVSRMNRSGIRPGSGTYVAALMACGNLTAVEAGVKFHNEVKDAGLEQEISVATCLVEFYGRCGDMESAKQVFDSIGSSRDVWAWNALLSGYSLQGDTDAVFERFREMTGRDLIRPNAATFTHLLCACSHAGLVEQGKEYLQVMERSYGVKPDLVHYTCVVDALGRADRVEEAIEFVKRMPVRPSSATWTSILAACSKWKDAELGPVAYRALLKSADKDATAYSLMANLYSNSSNRTLS